MTDLKIVVIDCPIETWSQSRTRELFSKLVQLKLDGYGSNYPHGALPLDAGDFVGTHILVCRERNGESEVVMGYKFVTEERSAEFNFAFPALSILKSSNAPLYEKKVEAIIERCHSSGRKIGYVGSWTMSPAVKDDRALVTALKELTAATHFRYQALYGIDDMLICGMLRFKTELFHKSMGYQSITDLPFNMKSLGGEPAVMLHVQKPSELAVQCIEKHLDLWNQRETLSDSARLPHRAPQRQAA